MPYTILNYIYIHLPKSLEASYILTSSPYHVNFPTETKTSVKEFMIFITSEDRISNSVCVWCWSAWSTWKSSTDEALAEPKCKQSGVVDDEDNDENEGLIDEASTELSTTESNINRLLGDKFCRTNIVHNLIAQLHNCTSAQLHSAQLHSCTIAQCTISLHCLPHVSAFVRSVWEDLNDAMHCSTDTLTLFFLWATCQLPYS